MDRICDYDEGYDRISAYEIGWCYKCKCNPNCPYKKKAVKEERKKKEENYVVENYKISNFKV